MDTSIERIGFVGTGVMGRSMAGHLMKAGYSLTVHNRSREKAEPLLEQGARWAATPGEAAEGADVVITIVGYPSDVEEVYLGAGGIVERSEPEAVLIDMTTSSPALARRIYDAAAQADKHAIDAPVSGGDIGARNATLTIMAGGDDQPFERVRPVLDAMGSNVILQGGAGAGQHTKMANQIAIAGSMLAMVECLTYARATGLDPARVLESVKAGSAGSWSLNNLAPRALSGDFAPGFFVKHFVKDLRIALAEARDSGVQLPGLDLAERLYERLMESGGAECGTQALWLLYAEEEERAKHGIERSATVGGAG